MGDQVDPTHSIRKLQVINNTMYITSATNITNLQ